MAVENNALFKLSYGLFVLSARDGEKDNGCIINTVMQVTEKPLRIQIAVNKSNYTNEMIKKTGEFTVSVLDTSAPFSVFEKFGFKSGKENDKFADFKDVMRAENSVFYLSKYSNAFISAKVTETVEFETHTVFFAEVTEAKILSDNESMTYQYYFDNVKPKTENKKKKGFVCKICGYVYEGDELPEDYICPLCKHPASDFEPIE